MQLTGTLYVRGTNHYGRAPPTCIPSGDDVNAEQEPGNLPTDTSLPSEGGDTSPNVHATPTAIHEAISHLTEELDTIRQTFLDHQAQNKNQIKLLQRQIIDIE